MHKRQSHSAMLQTHPSERFSSRLIFDLNITSRTDQTKSTSSANALSIASRIRSPEFPPRRAHSSVHIHSCCTFIHYVLPFGSRRRLDPVQVEVLNCSLTMCTVHFCIEWGRQTPRLLFVILKPTGLDKSSIISLTLRIKDFPSVGQANIIQFYS